ASPLVELGQYELRAPEVERMAALPLQRDAHVLQHCEMRKDRRDLERAHEAHLRDGRWTGAGDFLAVVEDLAAGRCQEVRQQIEAGGLAGAVRPDERMDAAATHLERHVLDGDEALELLGEASRLEDRL